MSEHILNNSDPNAAARSTRAPLLACVALLAVALAAVLQVPLSSRAAQSEGATITGVVQDDRGAPVADAKVTLASAGFSASVSTQADGKFEFKSLKPSPYRIIVEAARFLKQTVTVNVARPDEALTPPPIKLVPSSLHVAVFDAGNQPLGGVTVSLYAKESGSTGALAARTATDEKGDAYFGRLAPGSYQLAATLRGFDEYRNEVFISSGITTEFPLQLLVAPVIPINEKASARVSVPNLPSKNVQALFQDSQGWMWFGTDKGVTRFNGADIKSSAVFGSGYEQLAGEDVRSITEDRGGAVWIATPRNVRRITRGGAELGVALGGVDARQVTVDSQGNVWVATAQGAFKFNGKEFTTFDTSHGLASNDVRAAAEDKGGRIWIATAGGVSILDGDRVISFEQLLGERGASERTSNERATNERGANEHPAAERPADAQSVFVDAAGGVWLVTSKGLFVYDGSRLAQVAAGAPQAATESSRPTAQSPRVTAISQDRSGRMWLALSPQGVLLYDPARRESQRMALFERDKVSAIFMGREGNTWLGTDNGAVRADLYSFVNFTTSRGLADNDVRAVVEKPGGPDEQGRLWFITAAGVSRMQDERFIPVERFRANVSVHALTFDSQGGAWFATERGAVRLSGQTLTQINEGNGLPSNNVHWVTITRSGAGIIFATARGAASFRDGDLQSINALDGYDVRHAFEDEDGRLWFSTTRGVVTLDPQTKAVDLIDTARGLADNDARWVIRFKGKLLVATRAGIQVYNGGSSFTTFDGEPASTMFVDRDGYLWVGTDNGQVKKFALFSGYTVSTVYSGETYALTGSRVNSISEDGDGRIWIATDKGAVRHLPVRAAPPVQVSLDVDGRPATLLESGAHNIPHGQHRLTFHIAAISMIGQVRYFYRVNPQDGNEAWELLAIQPGVEREVSRPMLDEGAYAFEVIALNRDLYPAVANDTVAAPAAALSVRVGSPFWKRWWFYILSVAALGLALGAIFAAHRLREREYVLPKELRSYVPIEPNPYIVGNPIRTEKMFYGREDDFRYVRTKLEGVSQGVVIVFCGERRAGKSSILYQVLNGRLGERFIPVFVDMQEMVVASDAELFARMSRLMAEAINRANSLAVADGAVMERASSVAAVGSVARQAAPQALRVPNFDGRNPYPIFLDFLDEALAATGDRTLLILMDEYELMEGKVDEGKLSPDLFTFLAGLMDNKERLALIFTGSRRLEERDKKYWRELLRRSLFRKVGFLSEKDTARLVTEPVEGRVVFGRGVMDVIYRLTAGQPFYTQVICQNMVDYMNEHEQNWLALADLKQVIGEIVDNPLPQMIYTWDVLSDDEKLALSLLAETLADGNAYASARELRASVKANDYPVNLSENTIRLTLEEMFRRELLEKDAADSFRFKIDLFRLWIRRSHSIWQVVKEVRTL